MSYLNINYSTLEDAWGSNFEKTKKKKESSSCGLYNKRNQKTHKPYKTLVDSKHIRPVYDDENHIKYHGYEDGRPYSRKGNKLSKYNLQYPYKKPVVSNQYIDDEAFGEEDEINDEEEDYNEETYEKAFQPIKPIVKMRKPALYKEPKAQSAPKFIRTNFSYINEEDDDDASPTMITKRPIVMEEDDEFGMMVDTTHLRKKVHPSFNKSKILHETKPSQMLNEDSDDEFESYLTVVEEEEDDDNQYLKVLRTVQEEMDVTPDRTKWTKRKTVSFEDEEEEEEEEQFEYMLPLKRKNDRIYLDLVLYTISGIILIFVMEQFIQIGMKIKTPSI
jgi:hypothetical protein